LFLCLTPCHETSTQGMNWSVSHSIRFIPRVHSPRDYYNPRAGVTRAFRFVSGVDPRLCGPTQMSRQFKELGEDPDCGASLRFNPIRDGRHGTGAAFFPC
jgi:hypothetical protein